MVGRHEGVQMGLRIMSMGAPVVVGMLMGAGIIIEVRHLVMEEGTQIIEVS